MEVCVRIAGLPAGEYGVELRAERAVPHASGSESDRPERRSPSCVRLWNCHRQKDHPTRRERPGL
jgi:hypothetical protein